MFLSPYYDLGMKIESKNQFVYSIKIKSTFLCTAAILLVSNLSASSLLKRYKGSSQEKALDKQIKAYRPYALKNMQTFGSPYKKFEHQLPKKNRQMVLEWVRENPEEFKKLIEFYQKRQSLEKKSQLQKQE